MRSGLLINLFLGDLLLELAIASMDLRYGFLKGGMLIYDSIAQIEGDAACSLSFPLLLLSYPTTRIEGLDFYLSFLLSRLLEII